MQVRAKLTALYQTDIKQLFQATMLKHTGYWNLTYIPSDDRRRQGTSSMHSGQHINQHQRTNLLTCWPSKILDICRTYRPYCHYEAILQCHPPAFHHSVRCVTTGYNLLYSNVTTDCISSLYITCIQAGRTCRRSRPYNKYVSTRSMVYYCASLHSQNTLDCNKTSQYRMTMQ